MPDAKRKRDSAQIKKGRSRQELIGLLLFPNGAHRAEFLIPAGEQIVGTDF
jgi:hypothetical protein